MADVSNRDGFSVSRRYLNLEKEKGKVEFQAPLVVAAPTYNIIDELKEEGDWNMLEKYSGFVESRAVNARPRFSRE